jgi:hypothetical protein
MSVPTCTIDALLAQAAAFTAHSGQQLKPLDLVIGIGKAASSKTRQALAVA